MGRISGSLYGTYHHSNGRTYTRRQKVKVRCDGEGCGWKGARVGGAYQPCPRCGRRTVKRVPATTP